MSVPAVASAEDTPTLLHTAPTKAAPDTPLEVEGTLIGSSRVARVLIRYRGPGEDYGEAEMELQYGDLFRGYIPAERMVEPGVEYFVEGYLRTGERVDLFRDAKKPARVFVEGGTRRAQARTEDRPKDRGRDSGRATDRLGEEAGRSTDRRRRGADVTPPPDDPDTPVVVDNPPSGDSGDDDVDFSMSHFGEDGGSELEEELALYSAVDTVALATRHEEKVTRVPAIASSLNREQIRALGARSVYDVLDVIPGLTISRDVQGFYRTAVRGLRSDPEVLFLLNGHPLNNVFDGRALANLPVENIERIEVIRGPGSALYGTGAFLGVVNVVTTNEQEGVRASLAGGSFDTIDGHVDAAKQFSGITFYGDADIGRQTGYRKDILVDALANETLEQNLRTEIQPSGRTNDRRFFLNLGVGAKMDTREAGEFGARLRYMNEQRAALIGLFDTVGPDSALGWQVVLADLTWRKSLGERTTLNARAFFDSQSIERRFQLVPDNFDHNGMVYDQGLSERTRLGTRSLGLDVAADIQLLETNRLSVGAVIEQAALTGYAYETNFLIDDDNVIREYLRDGFQRPKESFLYPQELAAGAATSRLILGLYAQDQWTIVDELTFTFGFRIDATQLPEANVDREITGKAFVPSFNPRAGLVWSVSDPLVLKLLYGRAFRSPTMQELAEFVPSTDFNQGRFEGNPNLDPATVDTLELGADLVQAAGDARVRIRGNAFYENFSNPIAAVDDSGNVIPLRNRTLGVRVFGVEAEARLEASERANAWVNASWFRAIDLEADLPLLTDVPQLRLNAGMSMPIGRWLNFDLLVKVGVERRNNSRSVLEYLRRYRLPSYTLVGAQLRTERLFDHVEVALSGHNLLNVDYADDAPRPDRMPGMVPREPLAGFLTVRVNY